MVEWCQVMLDSVKLYQMLPNDNCERLTLSSNLECTVRKNDFFSSILIFAKEKFPQFIQVKRQMRAGLKEYPCGSLNNSANLIQYENLLNHY